MSRSSSKNGITMLPNAALPCLLLASMKFSTVCDGAAFDGDLVRRLGMRYLPSAIFVDAAGRVVARDLKADRLEQLVAEHVRTAR